MKKNKGFTLVELLAVIVVLGVLMTVAGVSAVKIKKDANEKQAKQLEADLTKLGESIYSYEMMLGNKTDSEHFYQRLNKETEFIITLTELKEAGYLKDLVKEGEVYKMPNPAGGEGCDGFILVTKEDKLPKFKGYINCKNLYTTKVDNKLPTITAKLTTKTN